MRSRKIVGFSTNRKSLQYERENFDEVSPSRSILQRNNLIKTSSEGRRNFKAALAYQKNNENGDFVLKYEKNSH